MPENKQTKAGQSRATIARLLSVAKNEFSQKGYAAASTKEIVALAGVTRGALYHHFKNKQDLFLAVFEEAQREIGRRIDQSTASTPNLWDQLVIGCRAFLKACSDPDLQQIVVIDAPAVLDWNTYRQVDATLPGSGLSLLKESLETLIKSRLIKPLPVDALAHLLSGAMDESAIWIAHEPDSPKALIQAQTTLETLLESLRI
jgi:AcrR family transcriptional regulator